MIVNIIIPDPTEISTTTEWLRNRSIHDLPNDFLRGLDGRWIWTYRTYLELKCVRSDISISTEIESSAINISHVSVFDDKYRQILSKIMKLRTISCEADKHSIFVASARVSQAPGNEGSFFVPHWPELNIVPRSKERMPRIMNVGYFGIMREREKATHVALSEELRRRDIMYIIKKPSEWNDYSNIDMVVGLRQDHLSRGYQKPGSKLYNAMIAGVPSIFTPEPSYFELGVEGYAWHAADNIRDVLKIIDDYNSGKLSYINILSFLEHYSYDYFINRSVSHWIDVIKDVAQRSSYQVASKNIYGFFQDIRIRFTRRLKN